MFLCSSVPLYIYIKFLSYIENKFLFLFSLTRLEEKTRFRGTEEHKKESEVKKMTFSEFKKVPDVLKTMNIDELEVYRPPNDLRRKLAKDSRSYIGEDGFWQVRPVGVDNFCFYIVCPYCGDIHTHGKAYGHRVSHCKKNDNKGYVIGQ